MKAFKVFWKDGKPEHRIVIANSIREALTESEKHGEVLSLIFAGETFSKKAEAAA